ncbi:hypothetical protein BH11PSE13_BH11PSE13_12290 [soil metagenome]
MPTITIKQLGERVDLQIRQGSTLGPVQCRLSDAATTLPIDLTGCTIRGSVRKTLSSGEVAAQMVVGMASPETGAFSFHIPANVTAGLPVGPAITDPASAYVWDMEMEDGDGVVTPLYYGTILLYPEVTKA